MSSSMSHVGRSAATALRTLRTTSQTTSIRHTAHRSFTTSVNTRATAAEAAPPAAEDVPVVAQSVLLRNNAKSATQTPGIQWTDGEQGIERQCRKMNMYTVRDARQRRFISLHNLGGGVRSYATASAPSSSPASSPAPPVEAAADLGPRLPLFKGARSQRKFPMRKTFQFEQYMRFLNDSKVVLILQHNNVDVVEMSQLRRDIAAVPMDAAQSGEEASPARLTVVRSGLLRKVMRCSSSHPLRKSSDTIFGPIALVTFDHLSPTYIARLFKVLDRALGAGRLQPAPAVGVPHPKSASNVNTRFMPVLAVVERAEGVKAVVDVAGLRDVSALPTLDVLRSQIVGLLSAVPSQLVATLSQASGGHLALTLDAHRRSLEESAEGGDKSSAA